jgi:hypothetical protein
MMGLEGNQSRPFSANHLSEWVRNSSFDCAAKVWRPGLSPLHATTGKGWSPIISHKSIQQRTKATFQNSTCSRPVVFGNGIEIGNSKN